MEYICQSPALQQQWDEIESISQEMNELAMSYYSDDSLPPDEQDVPTLWNDIAALDKNRMRLLNSFFDENISDDQKEIFREKIDNLLNANKELTDFSFLIQKNISNVLSTMGQQQRAVSTYGNIQSLL